MLISTLIRTITFSLVLLLMGFIEPPNDNNLFSIGRTKDNNEIFYDLNLDKSNKLNIDIPIKAYWLRRTENGKIEPLTKIQNKFGYGIVYISKSVNSAKFHFAAYDKLTFELKKNKHNKFKVFTTLNNVEVVVNRIYIHVTGGTFWLPTIPKVELHTTISGSNKTLIETIIL